MVLPGPCLYRTSLTLTLASAGGRGSPPRTPTATPRARSQPPWRAMEAPFGGRQKMRRVSHKMRGFQGASVEDSGGQTLSPLPPRAAIDGKDIDIRGRPRRPMKNGRGGGVKPLPIPLVRWGITIYAWGGHYRGTCRRGGRIFPWIRRIRMNSVIGNDPHLSLLCLMAQIPGQIVSRLPSLPLVKGRRCQRSYQAPSPLIHHHAICVIT